MRNRFLIGLCILGLTYTNSYAQDKIAKDAYIDFTVYRTTRGNEEIIIKTKALLQLANQLTSKQITNAEYHLGRMYEEVETPDSAIVYYEQSLKGEPNYFVIHRALGFIYLEKSKAFVEQMNAANKAKDMEANAKAFTLYKTLVLKAIPYLEKYQACEPDEDTLMIITNLYKSIKDSQSITTLNERLKPMSVVCVSLLDDE